MFSRVATARDGVRGAKDGEQKSRVRSAEKAEQIEGLFSLCSSHFALRSPWNGAPPMSRETTLRRILDGGIVAVVRAESGEKLAKGRRSEEHTSELQSPC